MKATILFASPRPNGNTAQMKDVFIKELEEKNWDITYFNLYDLEINPCIACRKCQEDWDNFYCIYKDDMYPIADDIMTSDLIVIMTPIYSWYCTPPMKALMDRLVYGMCKYYGEEVGPSLVKGKKVCALVTCGYRPEKGSDLFLEGLKRYCKHTGMEYLGDISLRHLGYKTVFWDEEKEKVTKEFAESIINM